MFDTINIDWVTLGVGFVIGVIGSWFVSDLVFPIRK
jgi:hypothetical protein